MDVESRQIGSKITEALPTTLSTEVGAVVITQKTHSVVAYAFVGQIGG